MLCDDDDDDDDDDVTCGNFTPRNIFKCSDTVGQAWGVDTFFFQFSAQGQVLRIFLHADTIHVYKTKYNQPLIFSCSALTLQVEWHGHLAQ